MKYLLKGVKPCDVKQIKGGDYEATFPATETEAEHVQVYPQSDFEAGVASGFWVAAKAEQKKKK